jgi:hypothetical protein
MVDASLAAGASVDVLLLLLHAGAIAASARERR